MYLKLTEGNFFIELNLAIVYNQNIVFGFSSGLPFPSPMHESEK